MSSHLNRAVALAVLATSSAIVCAQALPAAGYRISEIRLEGTDYEYQLADGISRTSAATGITSSGIVIGNSKRWTPQGNSLGQDALVYDGLNITRLGLNGGIYEYDASALSASANPEGIPQIYRASSALIANNADKVLGASARFSPAGEFLGTDSYFYDGSSTHLVGLTGLDYEWLTPDGVYRDSDAWHINDSSHTWGESDRYAADGQSLGEDGWVSNGNSTQRFGFDGDGYQYTHSSGRIYRTSRIQYVTNDYKVFGVNLRYSNTTNEILGNDAWISDGTNIQRLGFSGPDYENPTAAGIRRFSTSGIFTTDGRVAGVSRRVNQATGEDCWFYNGTSTVIANLVGGDYESVTSSGQLNRQSELFGLTESGIMSGYSETVFGVSTPGTDAWLFDGTTTRRVGLTGSDYEIGLKRTAKFYEVTESGKAAGYNYVHSNTGTVLGRDSWVFDGNSTIRIGLTGPGYEYVYQGWGTGIGRVSEVDDLNESGQALGYTNRRSPTAIHLGVDCWFFDGQSTHLIGLTGGIYEYVSSEPDGGIVRRSTPMEMNETGQAIGYSRTYNDVGDILGQHGWFYDSQSNETIPIVPDNVAMDEVVLPRYLTNGGVVLGEYGSSLFWWSRVDGFHDLGSLIPGGLDAAGWDQLNHIYIESNVEFIRGVVGEIPGGSPEFIIGYGLTNGQVDGRTVFLLTANIPEPSTLGIAAGFVIVIIRRVHRFRKTSLV